MSGGGRLRNDARGGLDLSDHPTTPHGARGEPTRVLLDVLDCDSLARREAERDMGTIPRWIRENLFYWRYNTDQRRQLFGECIRPRGYELGS